MSAGTLRDFFNIQSKTGLTLDRKAQIFANIRSQTQLATRQTTSFSMMRNSWYFKTATTAALAFTLIYILYTPISGPLFQTKDNTLIVRQGNIAQAGYVGNILATQGEINVVRNGISTKTSKLQWWDIVYLYNTSKADFTLRDGSHGVVEWPAQLTIVEHADSWLILSVDHARYMQIDKNNDTSPTTTSTSEELVIETSTSRITTDKDDKVQLALVTTQKRQFIQNKWDSVTIESIVPATASPITQQLASSHVAEVTDSVKVYTEIAMIYDELKTQSSSQTYDLTSGELAADDIKSLLTLNPTSPNPDSSPSKQLAYQNPEHTTESTQYLPEATPEDTSSAIDMSQPEDQWVVMMTARMMSDDVDDPSTMSASLSRQETKVIWDILVTNESWERISNNTTTTVSNGSGTEHTLQENLIVSAQQTLSKSQLVLLSHLDSKKCIDQDHFAKLQSAFNVDTTVSLNDFIQTVTSKFYLTTELHSIIITISVCHDDKN
jgi:hypothetical protein